MELLKCIGIVLWYLSLPFIILGVLYLLVCGMGWLLVNGFSWLLDLGL